MAIDEIGAAFKSGQLQDEDRNYNLKWMQKTLYADGKRA
jgi:hypothetical protein